MLHLLDLLSRHSVRAQICPIRLKVLRNKGVIDFDHIVDHFSNYQILNLVNKNSVIFGTL